MVSFSPAAFIKKCLTPLIVLGSIAMAISGVWVLLLGHWVPLWPGIVGFLFSLLVFPLLMLPAGFFAGVMQVSAQLYPRVSRVCMLLTFAYFVMMLSGYAIVLFYVASGLINADMPTVWPALIWSVAATVTPWALFATKDRDNVLFTGLLFMLTLSCVWVFPLVPFYGLSIGAAYWLLCVSMGAMLLLQAGYENLTNKNKGGLQTPLSTTVFPIDDDESSDNSGKSAS